MTTQTIRKTTLEFIRESARRFPNLDLVSHDESKRTANTMTFFFTNPQGEITDDHLAGRARGIDAFFRYYNGETPRLAPRSFRVISRGRVPGENEIFTATLRLIG